MQNFGIDTSRYQGNFNFSQAVKEGVKYAILKAGGSDGKSIKRYTDSEFENSYSKCKAIALPVGAYYYGADLTIEDAKASAQHFLSLLKGKIFEYPVYYDVEGAMLNLDKTLLNQIVDTFCSTVQAAGYYTGIYASASPFSTKLTDRKFTHWSACYGKNKPSTSNCDIWQFGGNTNFIRSNTVAGVVCDQDYCYVDFPTLIEQKGLNGYTKEVAPVSNNYIFTAEQFVTKFVEIVNLPTVYCNKYPRNLGYWDGSKFSFDCWNMIKAVLNGWYPNRTVGYYQKNLSVTGDVDGAGLLKQCAKTSQDFTQLNIPGTYLYMRNTHAGMYVGEFEIAGHVYNVIECTAAWDKKVLWSWVDPDGTRRRYKGSSSVCCKWTDWGLFKYVDYSNAKPNVPIDPEPTPKMEVAKATLKKGCKGTQVKLLQADLEALGYSVGKWGCDGDFGDGTRSALIAFQKASFPNNKTEWDGVYGPKTEAKMKEALSC